MRDRRGFTLIELIAVIGVLVVLLLLVSPNLFSSAENARLSAFNTKVSVIESTAVLYGQDNFRNILNGARNGEDNYRIEIDPDTGAEIYIQTIKVSDLIPKYLNKDIEVGDHFIEDPRNQGSFLDDYKIDVKARVRGRKVTADMVIE